MINIEIVANGYVIKSLDKVFIAKNGFWSLNKEVKNAILYYNLNRPTDKPEEKSKVVIKAN